MTQTAVITGASKGLGRALAIALADRGWHLIVDARTAADLSTLAGELPTDAVTIPGDIADATHRHALAAAAERVDLLVNNASTLGPTGLHPLADLPIEELAQIYRVNVLAPLTLTQLLLPKLAGPVINISSDAAAGHYETWGGYGSSKAALDHLSGVLAAEHPTRHIYAFDPGDMRTEMHQQAFPGEDISDRPEPKTVVPALLTLIDERPASGRYRLGDLS
ncbi:SDR family oxidoreductase [Pseudonocardiaceae bacterium YIM PH 21723]|nr:SDR family oxidoreductase [Pseudonocardiaceae bacterium YIM PH 21723]